MYAREEMNISANAPSPLLLQSSVQRGGGGGLFLSVYSMMLEAVLLKMLRMSASLPMQAHIMVSTH